MADEDYPDKLLRMAQQSLSGGVDTELAGDAVSEALQALKKQAKALNSAEYTADRDKKVECPSCQHHFTVPMPAYEALAKAMAGTAKVVDETARLIQFTNGKPDSRPAGGSGLDWLQALTPPQFAQVQEWVSENARVEAE